MKLLCLNIWGGRVFEPLINYIKERSDDTDIFCFQEVFSTGEKKLNLVNEKYHSDVFSDIEKILPNHQGYFASILTGYDFDGKVDSLSFGLAVFIKKSFPVQKHGDFPILAERAGLDRLDEKMARNLQYLRFNDGDSDFTIFNIHGLWLPSPEFRCDTPERIEQSEKILKYMNDFDGKKVLCGDFNLDPDTQSIKMLDKELSNLIKKYDVKNTRSSIFEWPERFADYVFVSNNVEVKNLIIPDVVVSDHLPLILDFN